MTIGQRETITYRGKVVLSSAERNEPFLPAQGIGAGLGEDLGIVLNRMVRGSPSSEMSGVVRRVTGPVVEESAEYVTVELRGGRKVRIRVADIVQRRVLHE